MGWIESHTELERHRKVILMAGELGIKPVHLSGHLHALWHNCLEQQEDGDLSKWPEHLIAQMAMWDGDPEQFVWALCKYEWLDQETHLLHDWLDYTGSYLIGKYSRRHRKHLVGIWAKYGKRYGKRTGQILDHVHQMSNTTRPNLTNLTNLTNQPKKASLAPLPAEAVDCAQLLSDKIFENFPTRTAPTEAELTGWAREADKLNRLDHHPWGEIIDLIVWAQADSFWRSNILSVGGLRKHWNKLAAKKESNNGRHHQAAEPKNLAGLKDFLRHQNQS